MTGGRAQRDVTVQRTLSWLGGSPVSRRPAGLRAGLLYAEPGYALRASAGPARTEARPAAPAGGPQAGQPGGIGQQLGYAARARNGDDRPDPAARQRQPLPRPIGCGTTRHRTHSRYFPPLLNLAVSQPKAPTCGGGVPRRAPACASGRWWGSWVQYNATATKTWRVIIYSTPHPDGQVVASRTFTLGRGSYFWSFGVHQAYSGLSAVCITADDSFGVSCIHFGQPHHW